MLLTFDIPVNNKQISIDKFLYKIISACKSAKISF